MISTTSGVSLRGPQRMRSCASTGTCLTPKAATRRHACSVKCLGVLPASVSTNSSCQEIWSRRTLLSLATSLITAPAYAAASTSPYEDAKSMQYGLDSDRRIRACPGAVNPNCVSTRSLSQMYSPAWRAAEPDPHTANLLFENALKRVCPEAQVIKQAQLEGADFRAFSVPGLYGQDTVEVMTRSSGSSDRKWESDDGGPTVTFRSMATNVKYIWPLQAPLADGGAQRKRLDAVRKQLGWRVIGCDYIECYS